VTALSQLYRSTAPIWICRAFWYHMRRTCARFPHSLDVSNIWLITFLITFAFWKKEKALKQRFYAVSKAF